MTGPAAALVVTTTAGSAEDAERIAEALLGNGLAACVQMGPIRSAYVWKGAVRREDEVLLTIKTLRSRYAEVEAAILEASAYETPEIVGVEVAEGSADYLAWIAEQAGRP